MDKKNALMEAVAEKVGKRAPAFKRKGPGKPGLAVMIAVGAPKAGMKPAMKSPMVKDAGEDESESEKMPKAQKIAALQEKIAALKAELALLEDEDEDEMADDEMDEEMASEDEESED
jgi:hypothetical protein